MHPTNADGKNITFKFSKYYDSGAFEFYNRTESNQDRIIGSTVEFKKDEMHPFAEWLTISKFKPIKRNSKKETLH